MEIYIDVILLENFIIDMFILIITSKILKIKYSNTNLIIASGIGAIYTMVGIFERLSIFSIFPFQVLVSWIMLRTLFNRRNINLEIKGVGVYVLIAFLLSGMCFGFTLWENNYSIYSSYVIRSSSIKYLAISIMLIYVIMDRLYNYLRERLLVTNFIYEIELHIRGVKYVIKGFLDTGNELREPITNLPCIIVEEKYLNYFKESEENTYYIPYSAIGFNGKIKGFKVDKVIIRGNGNDEREISSIICPCRDVLNKEKEFNALLSRGVI